MENGFGTLVSRFRVLLGSMEQRPMVVRDIVLTCMGMRISQGRADWEQTPVNDVAALQTDQVVYGVWAR